MVSQDAEQTVLREPALIGVGPVDFLAHVLVRDLDGNGRLGRLLKPQDTLARLTGDQFGLLLLSEREPERITAFLAGRA